MTMSTQMTSTPATAVEDVVEATLNRAYLLTLAGQAMAQVRSAEGALLETLEIVFGMVEDAVWTLHRAGGEVPGKLSGAYDILHMLAVGEFSEAFLAEMAQDVTVVH